MHLIDKLRIERIERHKRDLNIGGLCMNKNLSLECIRYLIANNRDMINMKQLSMCVNITIDFIKEYSQLDWEWTYISVCVITNMNKITLDQVLAAKHLPWDWPIIGMDINATCDHIVFNSEIPWDDLTKVCLFPENCGPLDESYIRAISAHKTFDLQYFLDHDEYEWDCEYISQFNKNVDFILESPRLLRIGSLSKNKNLQIRHVLKYPDLAWNWDMLTVSMPFNDICANPQLPWNPSQFVFNNTVLVDCQQVLENWIPQLCADVVFDYTHDFPKSFPSLSWNYLSGNACLLHITDEDLICAILERNAVKRIWRAFHRAITDPRYALCRKRLMREFKACLEN